MRFSTLFLLISLPASGTPAPDFTTALETAKGSGQPIAVLIHGSDWNKQGEVLATAWSDPKFAQAMGGDVLTVDIDLRETPQSGEAAAIAKRNETCAPPYRGLPAIALFDSQGRLVAMRDGVDEIRDAGGLDGSLKTMRRVLAERDAAWKQAEGASGPRKAQLLGAGLDAMDQKLGPKKCYQPVFDDMKKADPGDKSGYIARYAFERWGLAGKVLGLANKKQYDEAEKELDVWAAAPRLTPEQKQELNATRFALYRRWPERKADARKVMQEIERIDPRSMLGKAATKYLELYKD